MFVSFVIWIVKDKLRSFSMHCKCTTVQPLVFWVTKAFVTCVRLQTQPKNFQKLIAERKNQNFWFMEKHLSYNFHIWKNIYHRVFIQFSVRMELYKIVWQEVSHIWKLYDKKFWSTGESKKSTKMRSRIAYLFCQFKLSFSYSTWTLSSSSVQFY